MAWKNFSGGGGQQNNDSQIDNMIMQASLSQQLFPIIREIMETGSLTDAKEKSHEKSARRAILFLIKYCAEQCDHHAFTQEETEAMNKMPLDDLGGVLSKWQGDAGLLLSREPIKTNFFQKMEKYWLKVLENKRNYIAGDQAKYKIIIVGADKVSQVDLEDENVEITEEALEDLKARKDIVLKPQPSKLPPKTQDKAESEEMPKESPESVPEAENEAKT